MRKLRDGGRYVFITGVLAPSVPPGSTRRCSSTPTRISPRAAPRRALGADRGGQAAHAAHRLHLRALEVGDAFARSATGTPWQDQHRSVVIRFYVISLIAQLRRVDEADAPRLDLAVHGRRGCSQRHRLLGAVRARTPAAAARAAPRGAALIGAARRAAEAADERRAGDEGQNGGPPRPHARAGSAGGAACAMSVDCKAPTRASSRARPVITHAETPQPSLCRRTRGAE